MLITDTMNLADLAELMGPDATKAEARHMCAALEGLGLWSHTEDVPAEQWLRLVEAAAIEAQYDKFR